MKRPFELLKADDARPLLRLAKARVQSHWLHRWWCKKYNLPRTDPRFSEHTSEELLLEFFEDIWEADAPRALKMLGTYEGDIILETGDEELDDIERRLAAGEDPDVVLADWGRPDSEVKGKVVEVAEPVEDIDDDYMTNEVPAGTSFTKKGPRG